MIICQNCGKIMPDGVRFCANCGTPFHVSYPPPQYPDPQMQPYYGQRTTHLPNKQKSLPGAKAIVSILLGSVSVLYAVPVFCKAIWGDWGFWMLGLLIPCISGAVIGYIGRKDAKSRRCSSDIAAFGMILSLMPLIIAFILGIYFLGLLILAWFFSSLFN